MGYSLEHKRSSRQQQTSNVVNERLLSPQANRSLKFQDKGKVGGQFGQPYLDRHHELRQSAGEGPKFHLKTSGKYQNHWTGRKENKDDELVKHMSNLPGYLKREETGKNFQGKALSFGVLDWEHLEKWKHQKQMPPRVKANPSSFSSNFSFLESGSSSLSSTVQGKTRPNSSRGAGLSQNEKQSRGKAIRHQDLEISPRSTMNGQRRVRCTDKYSVSNNSEVKLERAMRKESVQRITSEKEISSLYLTKHGFSLASKEKMIGKDGETKKKVEKLSSVNLAYENCPREQESIVLLLPKYPSKKSCPELIQLSEPKTVFDGKLAEAKRKSISDDFAEPCPEIPNSCPLPVKVETNTESDLKRDSLTRIPGMEIPPSNESPTILPKVIPVVGHNANGHPSSSNAIGIFQGLDQETAEPAAGEGRHSSPHRRFSFSLSKISRSFSFKEGPALPQLPSSYATVKSGPVKSEASECLDNLNGNKANNAHSRGRSSPLRRLLDPLLGPKVENPHRSAKTVLPLKGNANSSTSKPINSKELLEDKKHEASKVEALLQLTVKNGLPLFKLAVDNNSDILVATMKRLTASGKDDSSWICTFYSVHEIKKKSGGWINQGHKGKSCGFGYNVVGQMKISSSHFPDLTSQSFNSEIALREFILYSVDHRQANLATQEIVPSKELAAMVIKVSSENSNNYGEQRNKGEDLTGKGFTECSQEHRNSCSIGENKTSNNSTVVILPGGVHSLPDKGVPSPLINRWKSGGSCDCGGWDVGCRLRILTNHDQSCTQSGPSIICSKSDRLDLFVQGEARENKPIFSLAPFKKGIYSVEFNTSISLLQAFSMCVAFVSSQKSTDFSLLNIPCEDKFFQESDLSGSNEMKTRTAVQGEVMGKYVPPPPPSPVGRV